MYLRLHTSLFPSYLAWRLSMAGAPIRPSLSLHLPPSLPLSLPLPSIRPSSVHPSIHSLSILPSIRPSSVHPSLYSLIQYLVFLLFCIFAVLMYVVIFPCSFNLHFSDGIDVECLFMCFFAIYMSSLVKYLFMYFPHFLSALFAFLLSNIEISLYLPDTNHLLDMCFANIFCQSVACFFIFPTVF